MDKCQARYFVIHYLYKGVCQKDNSIFSLKEYGRVVITVKDVMDKQGMTRNRLANLTGLVYNSINRYYQGEPISSVDLDILAKLCFVLNCEVGDILRYERPTDE